jgi:hypothetical protein
MSSCAIITLMPFVFKKALLKFTTNLQNTSW